MNNLFSEQYLEWAKQADIPPLTNTQHNFAEWLLDNKEVIGQIGDLNSVFISIRRFVKDMPSEKTLIIRFKDDLDLLADPDNKKAAFISKHFS